METMVEKIRRKYGTENLRKFLRYNNFGIPEEFWNTPDESSKLLQASEKIYHKLVDSDLRVIGIMTSDDNETDRLVAEIIKKISDNSKVHLVHFDILMSEFWDRWTGFFEPRIINENKFSGVVGIIGVTQKLPIKAKVDMLESFSRLLRLITTTGFKTQLIIGLNLVSKEHIAQEYCESLDKIMDQIFTVRLDG